MQVGLDIDSDSSEGTGGQSSLPGVRGQEGEEEEKTISENPHGSPDHVSHAGSAENKCDDTTVDKGNKGNQGPSEGHDMKSVMEEKSKEPTTKEGHSTREPSGKGYLPIETMEVSSKEVSLNELLEKEAHVIDQQHMESLRHAENLSKQLEKAQRHIKVGEARGRGDVGMQVEAGLVGGGLSGSVGAPTEIWAPRVSSKVSRRREEERSGTMRRRDRRRDEDSEEETTLTLRREEKERLKEEWGGTIRRRESGKRRGGGGGGGGGGQDQEENVSLGRRREEDSSSVHSRRREERRREEEVGSIISITNIISITIITMSMIIMITRWARSGNGKTAAVTGGTNGERRRTAGR